MMKIEIPFWLYWIISSIIATCICCGLNTGMTYVLYMNKEDITAMFAWPSTVAGDVVITIVSTAMITWLISCQLTMLDCSKDKPFKVTNKPTATAPSTTPGCCTSTLFHPSLYRRAHQTLLPIPTTVEEEGNSSNGNSNSSGSGTWREGFLKKLISHIVTGAIVGLILVLPIGIPFIVIGYFVTDDVWTMTTLLIYKGVLGGLLGLLLQPWIVILAATELSPEVNSENPDDDEEKGTADASACADEEEEESEKVAKVQR